MTQFVVGSVSFSVRYDLSSGVPALVRETEQFPGQGHGNEATEEEIGDVEHVAVGVVFQRLDRLGGVVQPFRAQIRRVEYLL